MSVELVLGIVAVGALVGVLSALFGVGGGILMVPFMVLALGETQHLAEGTSLLVVVPTAVAGVLAHRRHGYVSFSHALLIAAGGIGGAWLGAVLALRTSASVLQMAFGLIMAISGARVLRRGLATLRHERALRDEGAGSVTGEDTGAPPGAER